MLYCVVIRRGEEKELLVLPKGKTDLVMTLAHSHPMAGYLAAENTLQRLWDRFHWPGMNMDVRRFCQACEACQRTAPKKPAPAPLIPLPVIEVPFTRIAQGHKHVLVIVDYAPATLRPFPFGEQPQWL